MNKQLKNRLTTGGLMTVVYGCLSAAQPGHALTVFLPLLLVIYLFEFIWYRGEMLKLSRDKAAAELDQAFVYQDGKKVPVSLANPPSGAPLITEADISLALTTGQITRDQARELLHCPQAPAFTVLLSPGQADAQRRSNVIRDELSRVQADMAALAGRLATGQVLNYNAVKSMFEQHKREADLLAAELARLDRVAGQAEAGRRADAEKLARAEKRLGKVDISSYPPPSVTVTSSGWLLTTAGAGENGTEPYTEITPDSYMALPPDDDAMVRELLAEANKKVEDDYVPAGQDALDTALRDMLLAQAKEALTRCPQEYHWTMTPEWAAEVHKLRTRDGSHLVWTRETLIGHPVTTGEEYGPPSLEAD